MKQTNFKTVKFDNIAGIVIIGIVPFAAILLTVLEYLF